MMRKIRYVLSFVVNTDPFALVISSRQGGAVEGSTSRPEFTLDDLMSLVNSLPEKRIGNLLPLLPEEFRSRFVIIPHSRSLQESDADHPRVLMFNDSASLVLAFNGDRAQQGFDRIEAMSFDNASKKFSFREIVFQEDQKERIQYLTERKDFGRIRFETDDSLRKGGNPQICVACHREDPRPNWDTYPNWPGVFGEDDGTVYQFIPGTSPPRESTEWAEFQSFIRSAPGDPRYRFIPGIEDGSKWLSEGTPLDPNAHTFSRFLGGELDRRLAKLNFQRLARALRLNPEFDRYKFGLEGALLGCPDFLQMLGPDVPRDPGKLESVIEETRSIHEGERGGIDQRMIAARGFGGIRYIPERTQIIGSLRYLIENGLNLDLDSFSMTLETGTYAFSTPEFGVQDLGGALLTELTRAGDFSVPTPTSPQGNPVDCTALATASQSYYSAK